MDRAMYRTSGIYVMLESSPKPHERKSRAKKCAFCSGRGWISSIVGDWPVPCVKCSGAGAFRSIAFARKLGVNRRDVYRVDTLRAGSRVGLRVLEAIVRVFPEALR
jgi:hypothetical protein